MPNGKSYYQRFEEQLQKSDRDRLLLHACCCPCSSHCLEVLADHFDITVFFYNPNIDTAEEYEKRFGELIRFTQEAPFAKAVHLVEAEYDPETYLAMAEGREMEPERGSRCFDCYELRLRKTAEYAAENGFDCFSTTLSISPYKNADWLNGIGMQLEQEMREQPDGRKNVPYFLFSDFKKKNGYKRSIELSAEYGLYRQDYCGCRFSRAERERHVTEKERSMD
ncbi:MAG: epoxyqueuosine reductase QueH [Eubacterium sp.]|nr:epoxyqueuosine reductase QueH [Eubacterium sp.]